MSIHFCDSTPDCLDASNIHQTQLFSPCFKVQQRGGRPVIEVTIM